VDSVIRGCCSDVVCTVVRVDVAGADPNPSDGALTPLDDGSDGAVVGETLIELLLVLGWLVGWVVVGDALSGLAGPETDVKPDVEPLGRASDPTDVEVWV
jgi:hypothetical protein